MSWLITAAHRRRAHYGEIDLSIFTTSPSIAFPMVPQSHILLSLGSELLIPNMGLTMAQSDAIEKVVEPFLGAGALTQALILIAQTVLVGGLAIAFLRNFTESVVDTVHHRLGITVISGIIALVCIGVVIAVVNILVISVGLGAIWAIVPTAGLLLVMSLLGAFGFLAIGRLFFEEWPKALGVGTVVAGFTTTIPFGGIITTVASVLGIGAFLIEVVVER